MQKQQGADILKASSADLAEKLGKVVNEIVDQRVEALVQKRLAEIVKSLPDPDPDEEFHKAERRGTAIGRRMGAWINSQAKRA